MTLQRYAGESEKIWKKCLINEKNIGNYGTTELQNYGIFLGTADCTD